MSKINRDITALFRCGATYRNEKLAPLGLKGMHTGYLLRISAHPGISQDKLAQAMFLNKSSVARQVAMLEEDGFILRKPSASDKRVMELYPTEKTLEILPQIQELLRQWEEAMTDGLTEEEVETLSLLLGKMKEKAAAWMEAH